MSSDRAREIEPQIGSAAGSSAGPEAELTRLLTIPQLAKYLSISPKTVRRWVAMRRIPCVRIGTRIRFDHGDIVSWVRRRKEG